MNRPISLAGRDFVAEAVNTDGAVDTADLSEETQRAMSHAGFTPARLQQLAGKDGRIDSADEALALFNTIEKFPGPDWVPLVEAFLAEFAAHSVGSLGEADALVLDGDEARLVVPVQLNLRGVDQFSLSEDRAEANKLCFPAAVRQLEGFFSDHHRRMAPLAGAGERLQLALHETASGRIEVDPDVARRARAYIDECLDAGRPVLVGVSAVSIARARVNEGITEHFVTISGRGVDDAGRLFYDFKDPGVGGQSGRFYVDPETGKLFKPGKNLAEGAKYAREMLYEVSQVRTWKDLPAR